MLSAAFLFRIMRSHPFHLDTPVRPNGTPLTPQQQQQMMAQFESQQQQQQMQMQMQAQTPQHPGGDERDMSPRARKRARRNSGSVASSPYPLQPETPQANQVPYGQAVALQQQAQVQAQMVHAQQQQHFAQRGLQQMQQMQQQQQQQNGQMSEQQVRVGL